MKQDMENIKNFADVLNTTESKYSIGADHKHNFKAKIFQPPKKGIKLINVNGSQTSLSALQNNILSTNDRQSMMNEDQQNLSFDPNQTQHPGSSLSPNAPRQPINVSRGV
jgi:hypothetical protein